MNSVYVVAAMVTMLMVGIIGCEKEGPAERAGEKLDQAAETVKEKAEDVASEIQDEGPAEQLGEKVDETVEEAKERIKEATGQ